MVTKKKKNYIRSSHEAVNSKDKKCTANLLLGDDKFVSLLYKYLIYDMIITFYLSSHFPINITIFFYSSPSLSSSDLFLMFGSLH